MSNTNYKERERYGLVRDAYRVSTRKLTVMINFKSPSAVTNIEAGRSNPSYNVLQHYQNLFGISADWLMGNDVPPYQEGIVSRAECYLYEELKGDNVGKRFFNALPERYRDSGLRKEIYSLECRANLVYLGYILKESFLGVIDGALEKCNETITLYDTLGNSKLLDDICQRRNIHLSSEDKKILANFVLLMAMKTRVPIYKLLNRR